jgi:hypothetical protein
MARRFLNELRWHPRKSLSGVEITYLHRGAPGDRITIPAEEIERLDRSFLVLRGREKRPEVHIPYHRIQEIRRGDQILWKKGTSPP